MKLKQFVLLLLTLIFSYTMVFAGNADSSMVNRSNLKVMIKGIKNNKGLMRIALWQKEAGFPDEAEKAFQLAQAKIDSSGTAQTVFGQLKTGKYSVSIIHDENNNAELDSNWLGIPTEGYGFSNNAKGTMGPPDFEDTLFDLTEDITIEIKVVY